MMAKKTKRRVRGGGQKEFPQPHITHSYNQGMGGVDVMDKWLASYRPIIKGKNWYWSLLVHALILYLLYRPGNFTASQTRRNFPILTSDVK